MESQQKYVPMYTCMCVYTYTYIKSYFQSMPSINNFLKWVMFILNEYCLRILDLLILLRTYVMTPDCLFCFTQIHIFMEKLAITSRLSIWNSPPCSELCIATSKYNSKKKVSKKLETLTKSSSNPWNWIDIHKNTAEEYLVIFKCSTCRVLWAEPKQKKIKAATLWSHLELGNC